MRVANDTESLGVIDHIASVVRGVGPSGPRAGIREGGFACPGVAAEKDSLASFADTGRVQVRYHRGTEQQVHRLFEKVTAKVKAVLYRYFLQPDITGAAFEIEECLVIGVRHE